MIMRPNEISEAREGRIKTLMDRYCKYLLGLSNENMDAMIKLNAKTLVEALVDRRG